MFCEGQQQFLAEMSASVLFQTNDSPDAVSLSAVILPPGQLQPLCFHFRVEFLWSFFFYMDTSSSSFAHVSISVLMRGFLQCIALYVPPTLLPGDEFSAYRKGYWSLNAWFHIMQLSRLLAFQSTKPTGSSLSSSLYPESLQFGVTRRNFTSTYLTLTSWLLINWMGLGGVLQVTTLSCDSFHFGATCCNFLIDQFLYVSFKSDSYFKQFPVGRVVKHLNIRRLTSLP